MLISEYGGYFITILQGAGVTVAVSLCALVVATVFGLLGATAKLSEYFIFRLLSDIYTTLIRGIPELVLMLLLFYGGTIGLNNLLEKFGYSEGVDINAFIAGVLTIGFIYGAYMAETFRGAILAVPKGQVEAGWALGMGRMRTFRRIVLPQMLRFALPGFTNNWLVLIKATALVSLIGLHEITYVTKQASAATRQSFLFFLFAAFIFLIYSAISLYVLKKISQRYAYAGVRSLQEGAL